MNVKPGDLAYISIPRAVEYNGRVVSIISFAGHSARLGPMWLVRSRDAIPCADLTDWSDAGLLTEFHMPDDDLRPISGIPVTDDVTEDLKEPA